MVVVILFEVVYWGCLSHRGALISDRCLETWRGPALYHLLIHCVGVVSVHYQLGFVHLAVCVYSSILCPSCLNVSELFAGMCVCVCVCVCVFVCLVQTG